ncbi:extracellular solute-binding protein [Paenibacillus marinisediminis]
MKKMRKTWALLLSVTMVFGLLAGCGSSDKKDGEAAAGSADKVAKEGFPIVEEPITISMMGPDTGIKKWAEMPVFQEMEKLTNVKVEFRNAPMDSFDTKKNLVFASGDLPDVFYAANITPDEQVNYGGQGVLLPLEDLIENYGPNLKKVLDENPDIRKSITAPDGHIYALPRIDLDAVWYRGPMWYNGEFLKALNMEEPQTIDELYTYLKRVKTEDPNGNGKADEIPFTSGKLDDTRMWLLSSWGIYNEVYYADKEGKVHYTPMEEGYKEYLTFMNKLWSEDLLDKETFSQTGEQKKAKGENNQLGLFNDWHAYFTLGGEPDKTDPMYKPVSSPMSPEPTIAKHPGLSVGAFAITSSNKNPEASMRWIDYHYSYEGQTLFEHGPEGTLWQYKDKDAKEKEWLPVPGGGDREEYRGTMTPDYGIVTPGLVTNELYNGLKGDFDEWLNEQTETKLVPYAKVPYPIVFLSQEEQTEVAKLRSDLDTYVKTMEAKFVTGQEPMSKWDTYLAQVKKMGGDRLVEIYQAAYDRWDAN